MKTRYLYAAIGVFVMLFAGFVYAWSILSAPISSDFPQWSNAELSLTFTICMAFFCLGALLAGTLSKRIPVQVNVLLSAGLFLVGFFLAAQAQSLITLYLGYGVLCGSASGFTYNAVMSTMTLWFPRSQGLISGVLLMGFGSSSMIIGSAFTALTPALSGAWRDSFRFMGVLMAVVLVLGSFFFRKPIAETSTSKSIAANRSTDESFTTAQMLHRPSFWLFFLWAVLLSAVGLAIISQARPIAALVGVEMGPEVISLVVGMISVCNGLGRILFGALFDRAGRKRAMLAVNLLSAVSALILLAALLTGVFPLVVVGFLGTGLAYGGVPTMGAAYTGAFYGRANYAVNFSLMNSNLLLASFGSTAAGLLYDASGSYFSTFLALVSCSALALVLQSRIRKP